jgi:hypothetical protein
VRLSVYIQRSSACALRSTKASVAIVGLLVAQFLLAIAAHAASLTTAARAAPVTVGPIVIAVPEGFQAAQTQKLPKLLITAWTKSVRDGSMKTLLQINVIDVGAQGKPAAPEDLAHYAEKYLRQFLGGIERRRTNYVASPVAHIKLAGLPAARATWNGAVGGRAAVGVMYSVIVHNRYAVIFHTQDLGSTPSSGMFEAMQSIESARLAVTDSAPPGPAPGAVPPATSSGIS